MLILRAVLNDADKYGVDHRTPENLTPLMLAVMTGNVPLIDALLARGAALDQTDAYGRTPHMLALEQANVDANYASQVLGEVYAKVRPIALDVLVDGKLVRLNNEGAEYYFLSLMLALLPHYTAPLWHPEYTTKDVYNHQRGFFVDALQVNLEHIPDQVIKEARRKRPYFNHVLARAEVNSNYSPARKLWQRNGMGFYILNPNMQIKLKLTAESEGDWVDVGQLGEG